MKLFIKILLLTLPLLLFAKGATVQQLFSVTTVKVKKQSIGKQKKNYGYVKADEARTYDVTPRFSGYVTKLYANKIYKYVRKGTPLLKVYSPEVYKAKEDYINSYNYTKDRKNKGMLESAKLKLELLGLSKKEINDTLANKKASKETTIYAPTSGYIFTKNITNGSAFNAKAKLFTIVNLYEVWIEAKVFEEDLEWLEQTNDFEISFKSREEKYKATSKLLYPNLNPKEATLTLRLRVRNPKNKLFPGMYANIISKEKAKLQLTLPNNAVIRKNGKHYVFVVGEFEGEYDPLEVSVKQLNAHIYIIKDGLNAGDEVVSNALFMMDSDAQINALY